MCILDPIGVYIADDFDWLDLTIKSKKEFIDKNLLDTKHAARVSLKKIDDKFAMMNYELYYKDTTNKDKWIVDTSNRKTLISQFPAEIVQLLNESDEEVDITDYVEEKLKINVNEKKASK